MNKTQLLPGGSVSGSWCFPPIDRPVTLQGCEFPSARPVIAVSSAPWTAKATRLCNTQLAMKAISLPRSNILKNKLIKKC